MAGSLVGQLKAELKRSLRKHVGEAVNDICDAFEDQLKTVKPPSPTPTLPQVGLLGNEVNYECCRQLVEYIARNMDTSPGFAQQMDCVILAYQSNASADILNSVVTQNLWVRRKHVGAVKEAGDICSEEKAQPIAKSSVPEAKMDYTLASIQTERTSSVNCATFRDSASNSDNTAFPHSQETNFAASRPREWGKRKRLVTKKRPVLATAPYKRGSRAPSPRHQPSDQSSTESEGGKPYVRQQDKLTKKTMENSTFVAGLPKGITAAHEAVLVKDSDATMAAEEQNEEVKQDATTHAASKAAKIDETNERNDEAVIDLELRQVERDLIDGDEIWD